jgi:tagatose-6-phosphate ketose/aldose isomerase
MQQPKQVLSGLLDRTKAECESLGYYHTATEIASQPGLWLETLAIVRGALPSLRDFCGSCTRIILTGAGSSHFIGVSVAPLLRKTFASVEAIPSTEIVMDPESSFPREDFLLVSFARSGDSPESGAVVDLAEKLRPGRVKHLAITCNPSGALARMATSLGNRAFSLILPEKSNDRSLAMTSSFTCMTVAGYALAFLDSGEAYGRMVEGLAGICEGSMEKISGQAKAIAGQGFERFFFIASRPYLGGALEAQLKVQELSAGRIVAKADDSLGLRHGFLAMIDERSLIILFMSKDQYRRRYEMDLLREMRAKKLGGSTLVLAESPYAAESAGLRDLLLEFGSDPAAGDDFRAPLVALVGQLLGLHCSLSLGLEPDNPSPASVISRVVQGVTIYPYES